MTKLEEHIEFVNSQMGFHLRQSAKYHRDLRRSDLHKSTADKFKALSSFLKETALGGDKTQKNMVNLRWDEIDDLPEELVQELSISDSDRFEFNVVALIDQVGGVASIDRILVSIYQQSGKIEKRANLNARLYRMVQKDMIFSVPGKKGVYSTVEIEGDKPQETEEDDDVLG